MKSTVLRSFVSVTALCWLLAASQTARAQFETYNHPDVDWLSVETEHFIIDYYPDVEWTARMIAKYAEIMYPKITGVFDYPLKEKVHIAVRDTEDIANGYAIYSKNFITIWASSLYYILRGRQEWIPDCLTHEFGHIVSLKAHDWKAEHSMVIFGSGLVEDGTHNLDFGASLLIGYNEPYWWTEGIAEYSDHLSGFNWWTSSRDMTQRMSMLEDNFLNYEEMFTPGNKDSFIDRERGYQQGYAMGLYVMEKYGREQYAQLAVNSSKKGHLIWEKNVEDVLGTDGQKLFEGWVKWMKDRYDRQVEPVRKEEHVGRLLLTSSMAEEIDILETLPDGRVKVQKGKRHYEDPVPADEEEAKELAEAKKKEDKPKIEYWDKLRRKQTFEKDGGYNMNPTSSPDGKWTAYAGRLGVNLIPIAPDQWPVFSGRYLNKKTEEQAGENAKTVPGASADSGYNFSPDGKKVIFASMRCPSTWLPCISGDGYYRYDLYTYEIETEKMERLTKRLRSTLPAYSPDGKSIAFLHSQDGQNWLGVFPAEAREVAPDGTCILDGQERKDCIRWLVKKHDGTLLGVPSWSPDSSKIVIDLYRNHQQDIWMINADGSDLHPLTWDRAEDRDGRFTPDGKGVIFTSDRTGIFNAYLLNLETNELMQLTNVMGGVYMPHLTPAGNLMYSYFTSYGLKLHGLKKDNFYNKTVDAGTRATQEEVARNLAFEEPLPEIREKSRSYNPFAPTNISPPIGVPLFIYEREGLSIGAQVFVEDYLSKHSLMLQALLGQNSDYRLIYFNNFWYPTFLLGWVHVESGYEFTQTFDTSSQVTAQAKPHFDKPLTYKNRQSVDFGLAGIDYRLNDSLNLSAFYGYRYYTSKQVATDKAQAFLTNNTYSMELTYQAMAQRGAEPDVNPRGRKLLVTYTFARTGLPTKQWADVEWLGRANPPGDNSDDYNAQQVEVAYREAIPITWWNSQGNHTLDINLRGGWVNRNVFRWDEFFAGSLNPLRYVPTQSTTQEFAGYPPFSIRGETMLILGVSYRFPFKRHIDRMIGPFYFGSLWGEISATAGNLWGYNGTFERDVYGNIARNKESYWDPAIKPGSTYREAPFLDVSSSNGNYMLYDIGFSMKLKGFMFGYLSWNSFVRVAYPLNDIYGNIDANNDNIFVDNFPNNALISEIQPKSIRISIGIGSNFD